MLNGSKFISSEVDYLREVTSYRNPYTDLNVVEIYM